MWLGEQDIRLGDLDTSDGMSLTDRKKAAGALAPRMLVPTHSFENG